MVFDSIKRNIVAIMTSCMVILGLLWGCSLLLQPDKVIYLPENPMPLMQLAVDFFYKDYWVLLAMGAWMVLIVAVLLYRLNEVHLFLSKREPLLAIVFVMLMSVFSNTHYLLGIHFSLFLLILSLDLVFRTYRREYAFSEIFIASIYLSIATLFYAPVIYFLLVLIICLSLMKPMLWRDWIIVIAGLGTPYVFALFYYYFAWNDWQIPFSLFIENLQPVIPTGLPVFSVKEWIYLIYSLLLIAFASLRLLFLPAVGNKIKTIRINIVFFWMFLISFICCIFYPEPNNNENLLLMAIPATVLISNIFSSIKSNGAANILFILLFLTILSIQIPDEFYIQIGDMFGSVWDFITGLF